MKKKLIWITTFLIITSGLLHAQITYVGTQPGMARATAAKQVMTLENDVLAISFSQQNGKLRISSFRDKVAGKTLQIPGTEPLFTLAIDDGSQLSSNDFKVKDQVSSADMDSDASAENGKGNSGGKKLSAEFENTKTGLIISWEAELRNGSNYIKQLYTFKPSSPLTVSKFSMISLPKSIAAKKIGTVDGCPVAYENMFFAVEHPLSRVDQSGKSSTIFLPRSLPLSADTAFKLSAVWGVSPNQQLRRGFLYYLERERANPYHQVLHYNSWYDLSFEDRILNDSLCLDRIKVFGDSLITKRQVKMDAFLFDDGWDDYKTLWQFNSGFPNGFTNLRNAAAKYGAGIGVWMSPWGGYDIRKPQRLAYGKKQNPPFETNENGFSLAGPVYYKRFSDVTASFIKNYNVSMFKFDGVGAGNGAPGASGQYQKDIEALIRLLMGLREQKKDIFLSLTIGTWPSVYWLNYGDVIWRAGDDTGVKGKGSRRQQWMNYRDGETYQNVVKRAPFYPLSSLMYHGLCIADNGIPGTLEMDDKDIEDEIWSFFATGTSLQEMYVNPHKLSGRNWDCLKQAITWARANSSIMPDAHWIGGDPYKEQVYGYAAWSEKGGYFTLRNPSDKPQTYTVNASSIFELPKHQQEQFEFHDVRAEVSGSDQDSVRKGETFEITLQPFEFKLFSTKPVN